MPTISQLPSVSQVTAADQVPISQGGSACAVNIGTLLAATQPAILIGTGTLLGRTSLGPGGPDPVAVGTGLSLNAGSLVATGADHAGFPAEGTLTLSDEVVLSSSGEPRLLPISMLRGLFAPGANIAIDPSGTISATALNSGGTLDLDISALPAATTIAASDLLAVSQSGTDHAISYAGLLNGKTIDQLSASAAAADGDAFLVAQGGNIMSRQTLAAIWDWLNTKLPGYQVPTLEITSNTTLSAANHNGRVLICSQPLTIVATAAAMGNGFTCSLINMSSGAVTLGSGITTSSAAPSVAVGQAAEIICATYSAGPLVYARISGSTPLALPAQVTGLGTGTTTASTVALSWTALSPAPTNYTVQYRVSGTTPWSLAPSVTVPACTVTGLLAATSYDFAVFASDSAGNGSASAIVTATTAAGLAPPGQVAGVATGTVTTTSVALSWVVPSSGGVPSSYTIQYRVSGSPTWLVAASGIGATSYVVTALVAATSYDFEVLAVNGAGTGPASAVVTASTAAGNSATAIVWNMVPSGSYTHGVGTIGVNAQVTRALPRCSLDSPPRRSHRPRAGPRAPM